MSHPHPSPLPPFKVPVKVKGGRNNQILKGLESLDNLRAEMDVEMSWVEAFAYYFNFHIDPDKYLIQKFSKGGWDAKRHVLTEKIKVLLSEYQKHTKEFIVYLVSRRNTMNMPPVITTTTASSSNNYRGRGPGPANNPPPSNNNKRMKMMTEEEEEDNSEYYDDDEDDRRSDITSASQLEDLEGMGIEWEDLMAKMLHKINNEFRNSDFLKAREELRVLKGQGGSKWARIVTTLPLSFSIIRDLLGVDEE